MAVQQIAKNWHKVPTKVRMVPFSWTLYKFDWKSNFMVWAIVSTILPFYLFNMMVMFDPSSTEALQELLAIYPSEMLDALGMSTFGTTLVEFLANMYYGLLIFAFPMIYYIGVANKLVAKNVDSGSMAYLLQTPLSRSKVIFTQGIFLLTSILAMFVVLYVAAMLMSADMFPGMLDISAFTTLHFSTFLLTSTLAMSCFFYSCYFDDSKLSLAFGAALPVGSLLFNMLGGISDQAVFFRDLSIFNKMDAPAIAAHGNPTMINLVFAGATIVLFYFSIKVFKRKKLPL
ncbi:MAG: hypothetical protein LBG64_01600 [Pseudomonadales bacterium]|jgi:ABC-2 type transport system permease protein|nr:hypothetical protein [Pseudomonadales bacterium]